MDLDIRPFDKGQVWLLQNEKWTPEQRDSGITVGNRPVIIYRSIEVKSKFVTVIPITQSNLKAKNGVPIRLEYSGSSLALVQEIRPIPIKNLAIFFGTISAEKMKEIDDAVKAYLGLEDDLNMDKVFHITESPRKHLFDKNLPAPTVVAKNIKHEELTIEPCVTTPSPFIQFSKKSLTSRELSTLTEYEKNLILTGNIQDLVSLLGVSKTTVYRFRKKLSESTVQFTIPAVETETVNTDYPLKVYRSFKGKNLNLLKTEERKLFLKLNVEKLSKVISVPVTEINTIREKFEKEMHETY